MSAEDLAPARGLLWGAIFGIAAWILLFGIGWGVWLIVRAVTRG